MSNKLRSFLIVVMSIVVVMAALPFNALTVRADDYSLTYHVNGGGASEEDVTYPIPEGATSTIVLDINNPALEFTAPVGMVFACWAENADGSGETYQPGDHKDIINLNMDLYAIWGYTVTYKANGLSQQADIIDTVVKGVDYYYYQDCEKFTVPEDKVLLGWEDENHNTYSETGTIPSIDKNYTFSAQWANARKITFDTNTPAEATVSGDMLPQTVPQGVATAINENKFTRAGYCFTGWKAENPTTGTEYADKADITAGDADITLYAQWEEAWDITYDANNGSNDIFVDKYLKNNPTDYTLKPGDLFTFEGYTFNGWYMNSSFSANKYGDTIPSEQMNGDTEIWAHWNRDITLHANNGTTEYKTQSVPVGTTATITAIDNTSFTVPEGKQFMGWTTKSGDNTVEYADGAEITITGVNSSDIKDLYALWGVPVAITFEKNDSACLNNATGSMDGITVGSGLKTALPANAYTVEGYSFGGWEVAGTTDGLAITKDADGKYIIDIDDAVFTGTAITLKAKWIPVNCGVSFIDWDGSGINEIQVPYGGTPTFDVPTRGDTPEHSYTFAGWTDTSTNELYTGELPGVRGAVTYRATYTESNRQYSVTASVYPSNDAGTVTVGGSNKYSETAALSVAPNVGYHVVGWTNNSTDTGEAGTAYNFTVSGDHAVVVYLEKDPHTVNVTTLGGGEVIYNGPENPVYGDTVKVVATPYEGYRFVNWVDQGGSEVSKDAAIEFTVTTDYSYKAVFELIPHDISATAGEHGSVTGDGTYNHFDTCELIATPSEGYHFVNWTDENGTEVSTRASFSFEVDGARNLTANFAINSYSVEATAGEHGAVSGSDTYNHFDTCTLVAIPDKGYHFVGWEENGTVVSENANYRFSVTGNRKLKAIFEINMYTVTFKNDDGTILQEGEFAWGSTASYQHMANPTKKPTVQFTYTFAGWDNKETLVTKDITYTATYTYTVNKYKITFANEDGTVLQTGEVEYGKFPVYEKDTPTKAATVQETFTFAGWDKEISKVTGETVYTATYTSKPITKDSINYKYFTVAFVTNGGSEIVSQLVAEGGVAFRPEEPLRERYTFGGWYIDEALTKPFSFATAITSDITLYAKWIKGSPDIEATYAVVGLGSTAFELGSGEDITVAVERSKDNDSIATHFKGVLIDGVEVAYYNYELAEDNSSVIIRADALEGLDAGTHTVTIVYDDGTAEVELVVADANEPTAAVEKITETEAGDTEPVNVTAEKTSNWGLWIALGIVAVVVIAAIPIFIIKGRSLK